MKQNWMKLPAAALTAVLVFTPLTALAEDKVQQEKETLTWKEKIQQYQAAPPQYRFDDDAEAAKPEKVTVRFEKNRDGIYVNPDAKITNEATLMITGDLMCQRAQQEAAFTSSGEAFMGFTEVTKAKTDAQAELEAAKEEILLSGTAAAGVSLPELDFGIIPQPEGTWNFNESFRYVREILKQGDLVIGNLETMLSDSSPLTMQCRQLEDKPYLNSPAEFLEGIRYGGFDLLTLANNHNCDVGVQGLLETLENIDQYGFMRTGMFADEEEERYLIADVNGIKVGIVSYAAYFNTKEDNFTLEGQRVLLNKFDIDKARRDIKAARDAGAEFVIAFMHWGKENTHQTTAKQERYAQYVARAGADYIVGSHPHAVQPYDMIHLSNGREVPVIYSMGNFLSCMSLDVNNDSLILQLKLKKDKEGQVSVASHRLYPCTIVKDLETAADDGTARSDAYVVTPHLKAYQPVLPGKSAASKEDQAFMNASLARILSVYENQLILPLPYDPYGLLEDDKLISGGYILNRFKWVMNNQSL